MLIGTTCLYSTVCGDLFHSVLGLLLGRCIILSLGQAFGVFDVVCLVDVSLSHN